MIRPAEITALLEMNGFRIENGSNTRLADEHVALVKAHFGGSRSEAGSEILKVGHHEQGEIDSFSAEQGDLPESEMPDERQNASGPVDDPAAETTQEEAPGLIKAPKVKLPGLKVVGKVSLPEKKPGSKTPGEVDHEPSASKLEKGAATKQEGEAYGSKFQRPNSNPLARRREREAREAEKKERVRSERMKERRTEMYLRKVRISVPSKPARLHQEDVVELWEETEDPRPGLWGKFVRWLRRE